MEKHHNFQWEQQVYKNAYEIFHLHSVAILSSTLFFNPLIAELFRPNFDLV